MFGAPASTRFMTLGELLDLSKPVSSGTKSEVIVSLAGCVEGASHGAALVSAQWELGIQWLAALPHSLSIQRRLLVANSRSYIPQQEHTQPDYRADWGHWRASVPQAARSQIYARRRAGAKISQFPSVKVIQKFSALAPRAPHRTELHLSTGIVNLLTPAVWASFPFLSRFPTPLLMFPVSTS